MHLYAIEMSIPMPIDRRFGDSEKSLPGHSHAAFVAQLGSMLTYKLNPLAWLDSDNYPKFS